MDNFFNLGFLRTLESIRFPLLDNIMSAVTHLGNQYVFMALAMVILWCFDKKRGYFLLITGFISTVFIQFLKIYMKIPRPWVKDPSFTVVQAAKGGATGYSFPSGHAQNAVSTFCGLGLTSKRRFFKVFFPILAPLICFTRLYLGVHTLMDVIVGAGISLILLFALWPLFRTMDEHPGRMYFLIIPCLILIGCFLTYLKLKPAPGDENYHEALKNAYTLLGAFLAFLVLYPLQVRFVPYEEHAPLLGQILKVVLGVSLVMSVKYSLTPVLGHLIPNTLWPRMIVYFIMVFIAGLLWPMTFPLWQKVGKKKEKTK
ncbi:MAG: phosphatase PAP2 family protein [Clostridia bacterium]|nr:phosphatase PAP2 family protein [Clostridia bacterium]